MSMGRRPTVRLGILTAFLFLSLGVVRAQNTAVSPEVQQLVAEAHQAQSQGDLATAIAKYQQILQIAPRLAAAYNNLGMLYYQQHDLPQAVAVLEKGLKIDPSVVATSALLGSAQFAMGQYKEARPHLEAAVRGNPKDDFARRLLARDLISLKDYDGAVVQLRTLVAHDPKDQDTWYLLGKTYLQLSESALGKVNEIDPNSALAQEMAGEVMQSMGNSDGALGAYKKAVEIAPQQPGTHEHLADEFWTLGKWESARDEFQAELANDPNNCQARWKMANSLLSMHGSPDEAVKELSVAIEQCSDLMQARVDRGRALIALGQAADAVPDLLLAEKANPDEPTIHFYLANAYRAQGRVDDAHNEMQTYKKLMDSATESASKRAAEELKIKNDAH
jgi:tetratricopeptide (TPR) repeat protein